MSVTVSEGQHQPTARIFFAAIVPAAISTSCGPGAVPASGFAARAAVRRCAGSSSGNGPGGSDPLRCGISTATRPPAGRELVGSYRLRPLAGIEIHCPQKEEGAGGFRHHTGPPAGMVKSWACCLYFTMPPPAQFVARRCIDPALKGPNRKAQGNALGIEGDLYESALKGRHRDLFRPFRAEQKEAGRDGPQPGSPGVARGFPVRPLQGQKRRGRVRKRTGGSLRPGQDQLFINPAPRSLSPIPPRETGR